MEFLKVLNESGQETGEILDREIIHERGLWHKEVAIWIFNHKGQILLQRRSLNKKQAPNKLSLCAGHVESTKDSISTAKIELFEEIGIEVDIKDLHLLNNEKKEKIFGPNSFNRIFNDVYYLLIDKEISDFTIQEDELSEVLWMDYSEFKNRLLKHDEELTSRIESMEKTGTLALLDNLYSNITHKQI